MKTYVFGYYGKCEENNGYKCVKDYIDVKDYIESDNLKIAWITAAERALMRFGNDLDSIDLVTIIEN